MLNRFQNNTHMYFSFRFIVRICLLNCYVKDFKYKHEALFLQVERPFIYVSYKQLIILPINLVGQVQSRIRHHPTRKLIIILQNSILTTLILICYNFNWNPSTHTSFPFMNNLYHYKISYFEAYIKVLLSLRISMTTSSHKFHIG